MKRQMYSSKWMDEETVKGDAMRHGALSEGPRFLCVTGISDGGHNAIVSCIRGKSSAEAAPLVSRVTRRGQRITNGRNQIH